VPDPGGTPTIVVMDVDGGKGVVVALLDARKPDLALVDALVRLQLAARRRGAALRVVNVSEDLRGLLELVGLADVLTLEPRREAELGEQLGIEEVVQPGDPPA
jgi:anti-anti-sigma regulatory factor